jgi:hypothetical protein
MSAAADPSTAKPRAAMLNAVRGLIAAILSRDRVDQNKEEGEDQAREATVHRRPLDLLLAPTAEHRARAAEECPDPDRRGQERERR